MIEIAGKCRKCHRTVEEGKYRCALHRKGRLMVVLVEDYPEIKGEMGTFVSTPIFTGLKWMIRGKAVKANEKMYKDFFIEPLIKEVSDILDKNVKK
jgi:hypothetical protein